MLGKKTQTKYVDTFAPDGQRNGFLRELYKDGDKTIAYMTCITAGGFKGYHLHNIRASRYVVIKGQATIILYSGSQKEVHKLTTGDALFIPPFTATGLKNNGTDECWIINYPDPPRDPHLTGEQEEFTEEELEKQVREGI